MLILTVGQIVTGLVLGPIIIPLSWFVQTERVVNHLFDGLVRAGRNAEIERDVVTRRLRRVPILGMAIGVFAFGYSLANLLFG